MKSFHVTNLPQALTRFFTLLFLTFALAACGGGGDGFPGYRTPSTGTAVALNVMAPGSVTTTAGATALTYAISGGTAPYTVVSNNISVSAATLGGTNNLVIPGTGAGTAQVVVYDSASHSVAINVTVQSAATPVVAALSIVAPSSVSIALDGSESYAITGGKTPYTVVSNNKTVSDATLSGSSTLVVPGSAMGTAQIVVIDANGDTATMAVTVNLAGQSGVALYTTAPSTINIAAGTTTSYYIGGGILPYAGPVSSDVRYVSTNATGTNSSILNITGVVAGPANVVITDAAGKTVTIAVTVY